MSRYRLDPRPDRPDHTAAVGYERMVDSYFARVADPDGEPIVSLHGLVDPITDPVVVVDAVRPYAIVPPGLVDILHTDRPGALVARANPAPEVVQVWLHQTTGSAGYLRMRNHAGGPAAGSAQDGRLLDPDRPSPHDGGPWSQHTTADVEAALLLRGFRVVTRTHAAQALRAAGYRLGTDRSYGHALYADQADDTIWWESNFNHYAFAVADVAAVLVVVDL